MEQRKKRYKKADIEQRRNELRQKREQEELKLDLAELQTDDIVSGKRYHKDMLLDSIRALDNELQMLDNESQLDDEPVIQVSSDPVAQTIQEVDNISSAIDIDPPTRRVRRKIDPIYERINESNINSSFNQINNALPSQRQQTEDMMMKQHYISAPKTFELGIVPLESQAQFQEYELEREIAPYGYMMDDFFEFSATEDFRDYIDDEDLQEIPLLSRAYENILINNDQFANEYEAGNGDLLREGVSQNEASIGLAQALRNPPLSQVILQSAGGANESVKRNFWLNYFNKRDVGKYANVSDQYYDGLYYGQATRNFLDPVSSQTIISPLYPPSDFGNQILGSLDKLQQQVQLAKDVPFAVGDMQIAQQALQIKPINNFGELDMMASDLSASANQLDRAQNFKRQDIESEFDEDLRLTINQIAPKMLNAALDSVDSLPSFNKVKNMVWEPSLFGRGLGDGITAFVGNQFDENNDLIVNYFKLFQPEYIKQRFPDSYSKYQQDFSGFNQELALKAVLETPVEELKKEKYGGRFDDLNEEDFKQLKSDQLRALQRAKMRNKEGEISWKFLTSLDANDMEEMEKDPDQYHRHNEGRIKQILQEQGVDDMEVYNVVKDKFIEKLQQQYDRVKLGRQGMFDFKAQSDFNEFTNFFEVPENAQPPVDKRVFDFFKKQIVENDHFRAIRFSNFDILLDEQDVKLYRGGITTQRPPLYDQSGLAGWFQSNQKATNLVLTNKDAMFKYQMAPLGDFIRRMAKNVGVLDYQTGELKVSNDPEKYFMNIPSSERKILQDKEVVDIIANQDSVLSGNILDSMFTRNEKIAIKDNIKELIKTNKSWDNKLASVLIQERMIQKLYSYVLKNPANEAAFRVSTADSGIDEFGLSLPQSTTSGALFLHNVVENAFTNIYDLMQKSEQDKTLAANLDKLGIGYNSISSLQQLSSVFNDQYGLYKSGQLNSRLNQVDKAPPIKSFDYSSLQSLRDDQALIDIKAVSSFLTGLVQPFYVSSKGLTKDDIKELTEEQNSRLVQESSRLSGYVPQVDTSNIKLNSNLEGLVMDESTRSKLKQFIAGYTSELRSLVDETKAQAEQYVKDGGKRQEAPDMKFLKKQKVLTVPLNFISNPDPEIQRFFNMKKRLQNKKELRQQPEGVELQQMQAAKMIESENNSRIAVVRDEVMSDMVVDGENQMLLSSQMIVQQAKQTTFNLPTTSSPEDVSAFIDDSSNRLEEVKNELQQIIQDSQENDQSESLEDILMKQQDQEWEESDRIASRLDQTEVLIVGQSSDQLQRQLRFEQNRELVIEKNILTKRDQLNKQLLEKDELSKQIDELRRINDQKELDLKNQISASQQKIDEIESKRKELLGQQEMGADYDLTRQLDKNKKALDEASSGLEFLQKQLADGTDQKTKAKRLLPVYNQVQSRIRNLTGELQDIYTNMNFQTDINTQLGLLSVSLDNVPQFGRDIRKLEKEQDVLSVQLKSLNKELEKGTLSQEGIKQIADVMSKVTANQSEQQRLISTFKDNQLTYERVEKEAAQLRKKQKELLVKYSDVDFSKNSDYIEQTKSIKDEISQLQSQIDNAAISGEEAKRLRKQLQQKTTERDQIKKKVLATVVSEETKVKLEEDIKKLEEESKTEMMKLQQSKLTNQTNLQTKKQVSKMTNAITNIKAKVAALESQKIDTDRDIADLTLKTVSRDTIQANLYRVKKELKAKSQQQQDLAKDYQKVQKLTSEVKQMSLLASQEHQKAIETQQRMSLGFSEIKQTILQAQSNHEQILQFIAPETRKVLDAKYKETTLNYKDGLIQNETSAELATSLMKKYSEYSGDVLKQLTDDEQKTAVKMNQLQSTSFQLQQMRRDQDSLFSNRVQDDQKIRQLLTQLSVAKSDIDTTLSERNVQLRDDKVTRIIEQTKKFFDDEKSKIASTRKLVTDMEVLSNNMTQQLDEVQKYELEFKTHHSKFDKYLVNKLPDQDLSLHKKEIKYQSIVNESKNVLKTITNSSNELMKASEDIRKTGIELDDLLVKQKTFYKHMNDSLSVHGHLQYLSQSYPILASAITGQLDEKLFIDPAVRQQINDEFKQANVESQNKLLELHRINTQDQNYLANFESNTKELKSLNQKQLDIQERYRHIGNNFINKLKEARQYNPEANDPQLDIINVSTLKYEEERLNSFMNQFAKSTNESALQLQRFEEELKEFKLNKNKIVERMRVLDQMKMEGAFVGDQDLLKEIDISDLSVLNQQKLLDATTRLQRHNNQVKENLTKLSQQDIQKLATDTQKAVQDSTLYLSRVRAKQAMEGMLKRQSVLEGILARNHPDELRREAIQMSQALVKSVDSMDKIRDLIGNSRESMSQDTKTFLQKMFNNEDAFSQGYFDRYMVEIGKLKEGLLVPRFQDIAEKSTKAAEQQLQHMLAALFNTVAIDTSLKLPGGVDLSADYAQRLQQDREKQVTLYQNQVVDLKASMAQSLTTLQQLSKMDKQVYQDTMFSNHNKKVLEDAFDSNQRQNLVVEYKGVLDTLTKINNDLSVINIDQLVKTNQTPYQHLSKLHESALQSIGKIQQHISTKMSAEKVDSFLGTLHNTLSDFIKQHAKIAGGNNRFKDEVYKEIYQGKNYEDLVNITKNALVETYSIPQSLNLEIAKSKHVSAVFEKLQSSGLLNQYSAGEASARIRKGLETLVAEAKDRLVFELKRNSNAGEVVDRLAQDYDNQQLAELLLDGKKSVIGQKVLAGQFQFRKPQLEENKQFALQKVEKLVQKVEEVKQERIMQQNSSQSMSSFFNIRPKQQIDFDVNSDDVDMKEELKDEPRRPEVLKQKQPIRMPFEDSVQKAYGREMKEQYKGSRFFGVDDLLTSTRQGGSSLFQMTKAMTSREDIQKRVDTLNPIQLEQTKQVLNERKGEMQQLMLQQEKQKDKDIDIDPPYIHNLVKNVMPAYSKINPSKSYFKALSSLPESRGLDALETADQLMIAIDIVESEDDLVDHQIGLIRTQMDDLKWLGSGEYHIVDQTAALINWAYSMVANVKKPQLEVLVKQGRIKNDRETIDHIKSLAAGQLEEVHDKNQKRINQERQVMDDHNLAIAENNVEVMTFTDRQIEKKQVEFKDAELILKAKQLAADDYGSFVNDKIKRLGLDQFTGADASRAKLEQQRMIQQAQRQMTHGPPQRQPQRQQVQQEDSDMKDESQQKQSGGASQQKKEQGETGQISYKAIKAAKGSISEQDLAFLRRIQVDEKGTVLIADEKTNQMRPLRNDEKLKLTKLLIEIMLIIYINTVKKLSEEEKQEVRGQLTKKYSKADEQDKLVAAVNKVAEKGFE